jgi:hypothetical protein
MASHTLPAAAPQLWQFGADSATLAPHSEQTLWVRDVPHCWQNLLALGFLNWHLGQTSMIGYQLVGAGL